MARQVSYEEYHRLTIKLLDWIDKEHSIDLVAAPGRGGFLAGVIASHYYNVPFCPVRFSTRDFAYNNPRTYQEVATVLDLNRKVILIDDICDTGKTFLGLISWIQELQKFETKGNIVTASLFHKEESVFTPDYIAEKAGAEWIIFPYECSHRNSKMFNQMNQGVY